MRNFFYSSVIFFMVLLNIQNIQAELYTPANIWWILAGSFINNVIDNTYYLSGRSIFLKGENERDLEPLLPLLVRCKLYAKPDKTELFYPDTNEFTTLYPTVLSKFQKDKPKNIIIYDFPIQGCKFEINRTIQKRKTITQKVLSKKTRKIVLSVDITFKENDTVIESSQTKFTDKGLILIQDKNHATATSNRIITFQLSMPSAAELKLTYGDIEFLHVQDGKSSITPRKDYYDDDDDSCSGATEVTKP